VQINPETSPPRRKYITPRAQRLGLTTKCTKYHLGFRISDWDTYNFVTFVTFVVKISLLSELCGGRGVEDIRNVDCSNLSGLIRFGL
jgi:hypothetical protein